MTGKPQNLSGTCHCGAVGWTLSARPEKLVSCNCSICRRLRALWAHGTDDTITIHAAEGATRTYVWGDGGIAFHSCNTCGCTTHWQGLEPESPRNMAVNAALADPQDIAEIRVRRFDGADSWQFLD